MLQETKKLQILSQIVKVLIENNFRIHHSMTIITLKTCNVGKSINREVIELTIGYDYGELFVEWHQIYNED